MASDPFTQTERLNNSVSLDPEDVEVLSSASEPEEPEVEDAEFQAASQHLTQDFLCQVIQEEEEGLTQTVPGSEKEVKAEVQRQVAPLTAILGKLPSLTSLDLKQPESGGKPAGETHLYNIIT